MTLAKPLHIRNAEQLLHALRASGLTPQQVAEALHTAVFLTGKGNGLSLSQMRVMFDQELQLLEGSTVFVHELPKGLKL